MLNLFFDDYRVFSRDNVVREIGKPELIEESVAYCAEGTSLNPGNMNVLYDRESGVYTRYREILKTCGENACIADTSTDLIHWTPRNTAREAGVCGFAPEPKFENQVIPSYFNGETVAIVLDERDVPQRRYKALVTKNDMYGGLECPVLTSPDGIHWEEDKGVYWHSRGAEPMGSVIRSESEECYIIAARPFVGDRRVSIIKTKDFKTFTEPSLALWGDAMDPPHSEIYGLRAFEYHGWYIGFLHIYTTVNENGWKFRGGKLAPQLAYSTNGVHWQRFLREPIINHKDNFSQGMIFAADAVVGPDEDIYIIGSVSKNDHGYFDQTDGATVTYKLRRDGFACFTAEEGRVGRIFTRTLIHYEGGIEFNIKSERATVAVYDHEFKPIEGYGHEDCIPFSGDDKCYRPQYKGGRSINDLSERVICLEIKLEGGSLYSYRGNFANCNQMESLQYRMFKRLPGGKGQN